MNSTSRSWDLSVLVPEGSWRKSSFSAEATNCVEICFEGDLVSIRDSKYRRDPENNLRQEPVITVTATTWAGFLDGLAAGPTAPGAAGGGTDDPEAGAADALHVRNTSDGGVVLHSAAGAVRLRYTRGEWASFLAGVRAGELRSPDTGVPVGV